MKSLFTKVVCHGLVVLVAALLLAACGGDRRGQPGPASITVLGQLASNEQIEKGAALYQANCQICHGGATGGKLRNIPPPHNANGHTWDHADQQLTDMVMNGISFSLEAQRMPAFRDKLTEEDVKSILASIKTWWTEEQRAEQRKVTEQWDR